MSAEAGSPWLALQAAVSAVLGFVVTLIWLTTGADAFWPGWVWTAFAAALALHGALRWAIPLSPVGVRAVAILGSLTAILFGTHFLIWALSGGGFFWPLFPALVLGTATAILAIVVFRDRIWGDGRAQELTERVDELTRTRRGAVEVQAAELRRIERDLHDGAQARLVALSMQLGRAEERLADQPEVADLVRRARGEAGAAIAELRDLARGIAPPVLADRGLAAAVESLGQRAAIPVTVTAELDDRPLPVVETAAYFVVAESLTNVAKHAPGASAHVTLRQRDGRLLVQIADDGPGGADPRGAGLTGLRHRAEALDGTLAVIGGPGIGHRDPRGAAVRIVIAEDNALLREGLVALVRERGIEVVAIAEDGPGLLRIVNAHKPDLAIVDVRLPPSFTDEGVRAAIELRARHPDTGILILSQYVEPVYTAELLAAGAAGFGYLLKERVGDVRAFVDAIERVAAGGTALDGEVVSELFRNRDGGGDGGALAALTPREREVIALMAEGRTNAAIARELVVTGGAVEKHISSIFGKLDLPATDDDHRRVLAVLAYLRAG